ncbi:NACHT domain-containing protein [Streptomyces atratus]|uniref:NACHT domain-containing protein n=1 Tax=Streptomyces atratus TaxID=1893 RepID=UPI003789AA0C
MSLYEAALTMLLVRRDAERGIGTAGVRISERQSVQLLQALAYWLIRNGRSQTDPATAVRLLVPVLAAMPTLLGDAEQVLRHLLERCGLLREPAADRLEFIHRTFQDYLGARAAVEAEDISLLVTNAHEEQWHNVVKMAIGHARPRECVYMVRALVARGDHEELHRKQLHKLASSCVEYATELAPEVLTMLQQRMRDQDL